MSTVPGVPAARDRAIGIVATGTILAILYFARDVLVPITLAVILSLLISPLVRRLRRVGLGPTSSVLVLAVLIASLAAVLGVQVVRMSASLPQYEATIRHKLSTLNEMTVGRLTALSEQAERIIGEHVEPPAAGAASRTLQQPDDSGEAAELSAVPRQAGPQPAGPHPAAPKPAAPILVEL